MSGPEGSTLVDRQIGRLRSPGSCRSRLSWVAEQHRDRPRSALPGPELGICYLDSATYGLPPPPTIDAMTKALETWQRRTARWIDDWDVGADRARADFAGLVGVAPMDVGVIPSASVGVGSVAASPTGVIEPFVDHSVDQDPGGW